MTKQERRNAWWLGLVGSALIVSACAAHLYSTREYFRMTAHLLPFRF